MGIGDVQSVVRKQLTVCFSNLIQTCYITPSATRSFEKQGYFMTPITYSIPLALGFLPHPDRQHLLQTRVCNLLLRRQDIQLLQ